MYIYVYICIYIYIERERQRYYDNNSISYIYSNVVSFKYAIAWRSRTTRTAAAAAPASPSVPKTAGPPILYYYTQMHRSVLEKRADTMYGYIYIYIERERKRDSYSLYIERD